MKKYIEKKEYNKMEVESFCDFLKTKNLKFKKIETIKINI